MLNDYNPTGGILMMLIGLLFLIAIAVIVAVIRGARFHHGRGQYFQKTTPLDIAKERYAKGELTKAEFEQFKKDLSE